MPLPPLEEWALPGERAHAATFALFARATPKGAFQAEADAAFFRTGLPSSSFNGSLPWGDPRDLGSLVERTRNFCDPAHVPWSISLRGTAVASGGPLLTGLGFRPLDVEPALVLRSLDGPAPPLPTGFEVRRVRSPEEMGLFLVTMARGFGFPGGVLKSYLGPRALQAFLADPQAAWFVGFSERRPVSTALRYAEGEVSYVSMVSTVPEARKRGFGEAVCWRAVLSGRERGCRVGFLRASKMGEPIYRRMGFLDVTSHRIYAAPPRGTARRLGTIFWFLGVSLWFAVAGRRFRQATWTSRER